MNVINYYSKGIYYKDPKNVKNNYNNTHFEKIKNTNNFKNSNEVNKILKNPNLNLNKTRLNVLVPSNQATKKLLDKHSYISDKHDFNKNLPRNFDGILYKTPLILRTTDFKFNNDLYKKNPINNAQQNSIDLPEWCLTKQTKLILRENKDIKKIAQKPKFINEDNKYDTLGNLKKEINNKKDNFFSLPGHKGLRKDAKRMLLGDQSYQFNKKVDNFKEKNKMSHIYTILKDNPYNKITNNKNITKKIGINDRIPVIKTINKEIKNFKIGNNESSSINRNPFNKKQKNITIKIGSEWNPENNILI